ncbi:serine/threonine-protein kinase [Actinomadura atramentaria]|uniref:serine/threonine-protein kinase n=1 Tax=Actinomadura atramentaria TaxID=1990 RepID=UPI0003A56CD2|nr:serine/threonine-protein kinase [Actinomadura atramentaria]
MDVLAPTDPRGVGGHRITGRLGRGGMGDVYLGVSPGGRPVAVKVIRPELAADPEFRRRFRTEVEAARRVGGFHTAPVVDADPDGDPPWLVTAYVPGPSLADAIHEHGALPEASLRVLAAGLAEALAAVHTAGLVHRDLKPSNILLADDGPRVIDFGIARALDATAMTRTGVVAGTAGFMAPEQATGGDTGPAVDVFAFGVVLCHAAGVKPFGEGPAHALVYRVVHQEPDLTGMPDALRPVVADCLAKDPAARPAPADLVRAFAVGDAHGWLPEPVQTMVDRRMATAPAAPPPPSSVPPPADAPDWVRYAGDPGAYRSRTAEYAVLLALLAVLTVVAFLAHATVVFVLFGLGLLLAVPFAALEMRRASVVASAPNDLHVGRQGIAVRYGHQSVHYPWEQIVGVRTQPAGTATALAVRTAPGVPPPRHRSSVGRPYLDQPTDDGRSRWVVVAHLDEFDTPAAEIEALVARCAGPRWAAG